MSTKHLTKQIKLHFIVEGTVGKFAFKGSKHWKCKSCEHHFTGTATKLRAHFLDKCSLDCCMTKMPVEKRARREEGIWRGKWLARVLMYGEARGSGPSNSRTAAGDVPEFPSSQVGAVGISGKTPTPQSTADTVLGSKCSKAIPRGPLRQTLIEEADSVITQNERTSRFLDRFLTCTNQAFSLVEDEYFLKFIDAVKKAHLTWMSCKRDEQRTKCLDAHYERVGAEVHSLIQKWKKTGCMLQMDGWSNRRNKPHLNVMVSSPVVTVFLKSVCMEGKDKDAEAYFRVLDRVIEEIRSDVVVGVVMDNARVCVKARKMMEAGYANIYCVGCAARELDLVLEDMYKDTTWMAEVVDAENRVGNKARAIPIGGIPRGGGYHSRQGRFWSNLNKALDVMQPVVELLRLVDDQGPTILKAERRARKAIEKAAKAAADAAAAKAAAIKAVADKSKAAARAGARNAAAGKTKRVAFINDDDDDDILEDIRGDEELKRSASTSSSSSSSSEFSVGEGMEGDEKGVGQRLVSCPELACVRVSLGASLTGLADELRERRQAWAKMKKDSKGQLILADVEIFRARVGALIDSGATRSYISRKALRKLKLNLKVQRLEEPVVSILADNSRMRVEEYVEGVHAYFRLEKDGKVEKVLHSLTLLVEESLPFDIVLGTDWGEAAGATLHLREHECTLPSASGEVKKVRLFHESGVDNPLAHCCLSAPSFAWLVRKEQLEEQVFVAYVRPVSDQPKEEEKIHPWLDRFVVVYLDNILVFSKTLEEHEGHLRQILSKLRESNFKINPKKCEWAKTQVLYLGHVLDDDGIPPEDSKIPSIRDWPTPKKLTELRSFLGLANYYRKFMRNFSTIAAPRRRLLKKEAIWKWDQDCTSAFKKLKKASIEYPVLKVIDPSLPFVITTDASQYGIGVVLQQDDGNGYRPVEFMSPRLPSEKVAASTYERELYALRQALKHWKHYLLGRHFKVYSDHETLRWLKTQAKMTPKLTRWAAEIDQYDFELKPVKGKYNVVADALSRRSDYFGAIVHYLDIGADLQQKVRDAYAQDPIYSELLKREKEAPDSEPHYRTTNGLVFEKTNVADRLCVPNSEEIRSLILGECHDTEGHFGWQKTLANLMMSYTWPGMKADCIEYVRSCEVCQRNKATTRAPLGLLRPLPIPSGPGDSVSIDFMDTGVRSRHGKTQVMVMVDRFSKYAVFVPLPSEARTELVIRKFFDFWVSENGMPLSIVPGDEVGSEEDSGHSWPVG
ncbi:hypothetical protein CBR_g36477 [Chara braunii]|uniref:RNA-directed DNA polymerase n=1 Tax=Chara braunii TaxID=69332 RepID=A0A388LL28_CHABU|nr:hypothetical protein CBR_g36477 [Chara braunii]|eukprot:GBG82951.1 hypothetical protein CBR_g36477 [Chara braunii]